MADLTWDEAARIAQAHQIEQRRRDLAAREGAAFERLTSPGCICEPLLGTTCAMHAEQARAVAAGRPMVDEITVRAAGWVPLDEVLDALRDDGALDQVARRAGLFPGQLNTRQIRNYLTERFGQNGGGDAA